MKTFFPCVLKLLCLAQQELISAFILQTATFSNQNWSSAETSGSPFYGNPSVHNPPLAVASLSYKTKHFKKSLLLFYILCFSPFQTVNKPIKRWMKTWKGLPVVTITLQFCCKISYKNEIKIFVYSTKT